MATRQRTVKKTEVIDIYVTARGEEIPVREMANPHLINAFALICSEEEVGYAPKNPDYQVLRKELERRLALQQGL